MVSNESVEEGASMKNNRLNTLTNGIVKSNPTFRLVLGTCPTLAVTTQAINGLAMGAAVTFVLLCHKSFYLHYWMKTYR